MSDFQNFLEWLQNYHNTIMDKENLAKTYLKTDDAKKYTQFMQEKAELVASLAKEALPHLQPLPEELRDRIKRKLMRFSQSAAYGLKLNSVFYYSALLYRDDHKDGEPDTLQEYINELSSEANS